MYKYIENVVHKKTYTHTYTYAQNISTFSLYYEERAAGTHLMLETLSLRYYPLAGSK